MIKPEDYIGREQTYVKHLVLQLYLERVAWNIFSFSDEFVYVDGFSGPWKSSSESYNDTSFSIALTQLRKVRDDFKNSFGKDVRLRCYFIEKDQTAFAELREVVQDINDVEIEIANGHFEDLIDSVCQFSGRSFALIFIDPTGWQGFPLLKIEPLLKLRGEVLINFMSDFINRFIDDPRPEIARSFDSLFGPDWYQEWRTLVGQGLSREAAAIEVYSDRLKDRSNYKFVTSTRILKPMADRSYFYLVYGTEHWKGISEFRSVEQRAIEEQERVRDAKKYGASIERTGQPSFFGAGLIESPIKSYHEERETQLTRGHLLLLDILRANRSGVKFESLIGPVLEIPMVWESDLKEWIRNLVAEGLIEIPGWTSRRKVPYPTDQIIPKAI